MGSHNEPAFDPLNPTPQEDCDIVAGYFAAFKDDALPNNASIAFEHGWRMRRNDMAHVVDADQRELARRHLAATRPTATGGKDA